MTTLEATLAILTPLVGVGGPLAVWLRMRGDRGVAREQGAAAVVPQLLERMETQDARLEAAHKRIDEVTGRLDACEERHGDCERQLQAMAQRADDTSRIEVIAERVLERRTKSDPAIAMAPAQEESER